MAFQKKNFRVRNIPSLILGLNDLQSSDEIAQEELSNCENYTVENNSMATAPGYVTHDDSIETNTGPFWGGTSFKKVDGDIANVRQRQGVLEYALNGSSIWTTCTLPTEGSPATAISLTEIPCVFASLNDIVLWTNGTDTIMSSADGITWVLQAALPKCKVILENAKNRLVYIAQTTNPFRIDWSGINDPLTIGASSYQLLDPNNYGFILGGGLTPDGTTLIFKEGGLYTISDYVDDGIIDMNFVGAIKFSSHQTVQTTENSVIWYGLDYFYEFIGGTVRAISGKINPVGRNGVKRGDLMCSGFDNGKYYCSMPDANVDLTYNSQEYVIHKTINRQDASQPYVITRNRRYFGCYFKEDYDNSGGGRDIRLYVGDSRTADQLPSEGSPAVREDPIFAYVDLAREENQGLAGESQEAFFETKYFTENVPFYVKKYKKAFTNCKFVSSATIKVGYRFDKFAEYVEVSIPVETSQIDIKYEDGNQGDFAEGYGFSQESINNLFVDLENTEKPRGIQFKIATNEIKDVIIFGLAYKFQIKSGKFK